MMLGVRAHDFGKMPIEELAKKISEKGFTSIQLALSKAVAGIDASLGKLSPGLARYIGSALSDYGIRIAVLGCYINPVHPDKEVRKRELARFKEHIRFARDFGCSIVATETGSMNADCSYSPLNASEEAFEMIVESVEELVHEAEKFGVFVCIEGVTKHTISTPQKMRRILDTVQSNNLQVLFDPANLVPEDNIESQQLIVKQAFELFGERILIMHAKDFVLEGDVKKSVEIGTGIMDFEVILKNVKELKPYLDILIEDSKPELMDKGAKFIREVYSRV
ncbi:MAG: sugar phosphate isomerase/epimerase family protein [Bacillota bacterium]|nr:sugar phosphate isomerase/epimerase family protein [Bacillota bacterium]